MRTNITKISVELIRSQKKIFFYVRPIIDDVQGFSSIGWIFKRERLLGIYDVWTFFLDSGSASWKF